jgi:hypothetical protein
MGEARIVVLPPVKIIGVGWEVVPSMGAGTSIVSSRSVGTFAGLNVPRIGAGVTVTFPAIAGANCDAVASIGAGVTTALAYIAGGG